MNEEVDPDGDLTAGERSLLATLDRLAAGGEPPFGAGAGERGAIAAFAALPWAEEISEPRSGLRGEILAAVASPATGGAQVESPGSPPARPAWWPLAAVLAVALAGLAAWQYGEVAQQRRAIEALRAELEAIVERGDSAGRALAESRSRLAMVTTPGAEFCILKPAGDEPLYPAAVGTLVVAADRGGWYLRVQGLEPCAQGRAYKLWFLTPAGPRAGPSFRVDGAQHEIELADREVPSGVIGVAITLEDDEAAETPAGPRVLFADEAMRLL